MKCAFFSVAAMDYFRQQDKSFAGGNSLNQSIRVAQQGFQSAFVGALGDDKNGDQIFELLSKSNVNVSHTHRLAGSTASNILINDEVGERYGVDGAWRGGVYEGYRLSGEDWAFLDSYDCWSTHINCPSIADTLVRKSSAKTLAIDFLHLKEYETLERNHKVIDIAYFGGNESMASELAALAQRIDSVVVLTLGQEGSVAFQGGAVVRQEALPVAKVTDTTGCGDAFQAAFTMAYKNTGCLRESLHAGAVLGRDATSHYGGVQW